jgi:hypothetical protein
MADDPPISTTVPETTTVQTGADTETLGNLNEAFSDFWKEQDTEGSSGSAAPAAPGEPGAGQETKPDKEPKPETSPTEPAETPVTTPKEPTDEEIEKLEAGEHTRPEAVANFKFIKELLKAERAKSRAAEAARVQYERDLSEARQNAMTPEVRADYEHAASIRRQFDFASDPEFVTKYQAPIRSQYEAILDEAVAALPDQAAAQEWAAYMKQNYTPEQLSRQWWQEKVLAKIPNEMDRTGLLGSVTQLLRLQKERDSEVSKHATDKGAFEQWINNKVNTTSQRVTDEIMSEIREREKTIQDYLPRNEDDAKTDQERAAIKEHNTRFNALNEHFKTQLHDIAKNGPRAWVRACIESTRAKILDENFKSLEKEHKSVCAERDKYKAELDKLVGARRKLSSTTGTPPASSQKSGGLSIKDLDVRKSFEKFDWGDST